MKTIYEGRPHSGKTTSLINEYTRLLSSGVKSDQILTLLLDTAQIKKWREAISAPITGPWQIFTYWGFIQKEIIKYWPWLTPYIAADKQIIRPTFLNAESAHYLMTILVEENRPHNSLHLVTATSSQIALQILNNLNQAAINGLSLDEAEKRLLQSGVSDGNKTSIYKDSFTIAKLFRRQCYEANCLDYSLVVRLYNKFLLPDLKYRESLVRRWPYLIVDNLEEAIPAQISLINQLQGSVQSACFAFDLAGGYSRSFGASPEQARAVVYPQSIIIKLDHLFGCTVEAARLAQQIGQNIRSGENRKIPASVLTQPPIAAEFRATMLADLGQAIINRLQAGASPNDIAVITPSIDKVLEQTLSHQLGEAGFGVQSLSQRPALVEEEYAQVLVNLAAMIQPSLTWTGSVSSLGRCLAIVLDLDPIRSVLLARHCIVNGAIVLPDLDELGLRARIGFEAGRKYDLIRSWINQMTEQPAPIENLFQRIFSEILAPIVRQPDDIVTSRQIIHSAIQFRKVYEVLPYFQQKPFVERFLELIMKGTVASEAYYRQELKEDAVIISTPRTFFKSGLSAPHQFWVDCTSPTWFRGDQTELSNPHVLRQNWRGNWDDLVDLEIRRDKAATIVAGLLYRCRRDVTIVESNFSSLGFEMDGQLSEIIWESVVKPV